MAMESNYSSAVRVELNGGTSPTTGNMVVKSVAIPKTEVGASAGKIMSIVGALLNCLEYDLVRVKRTLVTVIEN